MSMVRSQRKTLNLLAMVVLGSLLGCTQADAQRANSKSSATTPSKPMVIEIGKRFPDMSMKNLNGPAEAPEMDLAQVIAKKPVIFMYWIAGNPRADEALQKFDAMASELGADKVAAFGLTFPQQGRGPDVIRKRLSQLEVKLPILEDKAFRLGQMLKVQSAPFMAILDAEGTLKLSNGASFNQVLELDMTLESAIRRVAEKGTLGKYGYLPRYFPVQEMVGKQCPDFRAPRLTDSVEERWHSLIDEEKLNILIFWSVDCPHCRQSLPEIDAWAKTQPGGVNIISAAASSNEKMKTKTRDFCNANGFSFPTLVDQNGKISNLYQVTSTPTVVIIRPDGVVDSVMLTTDKSFGAHIEEKKRELL